MKRRRLNGQADAQGDSVVRDGAAWYSKYVGDPAHPEPADWIWKRIVDSETSAVVLLESIAEHGFLRLAHRRGLAIEVVNTGSVTIATDLNDGEWVADYALDCIESTSNAEIPNLFKPQRMKYWLEDGGRWYSASGKVEGKLRRWCLLRVYHPSVRHDRRFDPQYRKTIKVLERMLATCT